MPHTSVILRCPDALYAWYEADLTPGITVEQRMMTVLTEWQRIQREAASLNARPHVVYQSAEQQEGVLRFRRLRR